METIVKYPRTQHIAGSQLQPGDEDLTQVSLRSLRGVELVIEEKLDGANAAVSFGKRGELLLQSRGHFLTGGYRERHFALFKTWAATHQEALKAVLGERYIMYGEWLFAKHTVYYDVLPHYFMEFDVWDKQAKRHLSTPRRAELLRGLQVESVPVLHRGPIDQVAQLRHLVRRSLFKSPTWLESLFSEATSQGLDTQQIIAETDREDLAEGLYIKHEQDGHVVGRYKFVRPSFLQNVQESGSHWLDRPIVPNRLGPGVALYEGER